MKLLALAVAVEAALVVTVVDVINGVAGSVAVLGAAVMAVPVLWRATKPLRTGLAHIREIRDAVLGDEDTPSLPVQVGSIRDRVDAIEGHIGVVADADAANVRAALAQYERRGPSVT